MLGDRLVRAIQRNEGLRRSIDREKPIKFVASGHANDRMLVIDVMAQVVEMSIGRSRKIDHKFAG
ncbi:hypothetical protein CA13_31290 [Planctomycetes bacterium CA13]|uniref:Uncharacterized protein n=1 Tax=Novipirellula herctigrandis TaxID=2527986 RepID=A0A5C5Z3V3_9BACT|nr:hypothetical protein CA13_31290 [Planctomycetes bacterium CA13]